MGSIYNEPENNRVVVEMTIDELLPKPYYLPDKDGGKPEFSGDTLADAVRRLGWLMLNKHGRKFLKDRSFRYGDINVIDGKVYVAFYESLPEVDPPPGPP